MTIPSATERARLLALCDRREQAAELMSSDRKIEIAPATVRAMVEACEVLAELVEMADDNDAINATAREYAAWTAARRLVRKP